MTGRVNQVKSFKKKKEPLVFDMKSRSEFLGGFSKRKAERKKKGNLKNLKKELKRKKEEQTMFKQHVQTEYQKAVDATVHNFGKNEELIAEKDSLVTTDVLEERVDFYPKDMKASQDPFGDVSIQISSMESPQFSMLNRASSLEPSTEAPKGQVPSKKKTPVFARFKQLNKSNKLFSKRIDKRKENRRHNGSIKKKKSKKSHS